MLVFVISESNRRFVVFGIIVNDYWIYPKLAQSLNTLNIDRLSLNSAEKRQCVSEMKKLWTMRKSTKYSEHIVHVPVAI